MTYDKLKKENYNNISNNPIYDKKILYAFYMSVYIDWLSGTLGSRKTFYKVILKISFIRTHHLLSMSLYKYN